MILTDKCKEEFLKWFDNEYPELAGYFKTTAYYVQTAIDNYLKEPYIIKQSKMNEN